MQLEMNAAADVVDAVAMVVNCDFLKNATRSAIHAAVDSRTSSFNCWQTINFVLCCETLCMFADGLLDFEMGEDWSDFVKMCC
jgi:uncharacterized protein CbrC (UPF0167 family)